MSEGVDGFATSTSAAHSEPEADHSRRDPQPPSRRLEGGIAALSLAGFLAPVIGQAAAVLAYPLLPTRSEPFQGIPQTPVAALGIAAVVTIVVWILEFLVVAPMTSASRAQPRLYTELLKRCEQTRRLWVQMDQLRTPVDDQTPVEVQEARSELEWARRELLGKDSGPGLRWARAYGYVGVLRALHRADEALFLVEPHDSVLSDAVSDELALDGSTIDSRDDLRKRITDARGGLIGASYSPPGAGAPGEVQPVSNKDQVALDKDRQARQKLRTVRNAINTFRDDAREGVIRARNQLILVMFVVSALTFLLFGLAEVCAVPIVCFTTAAALYLVGAMVGCFNRLRIEARQSSQPEDFGLFPARLMAMLLLSGLAAVGGVYLVAALPSVLPLAASGDRSVPKLWVIFDLSNNPIGLLWAAVFGLVPENLTKLLVGTADKLQTDLLASRPANSTASLS